MKTTKTVQTKKERAKHRLINLVIYPNYRYMTCGILNPENLPASKWNTDFIIAAHNRRLAWEAMNKHCTGGAS